MVREYPKKKHYYTTTSCGGGQELLSSGSQELLSSGGQELLSSEFSTMGLEGPFEPPPITICTLRTETVTKYVRSKLGGNF